jgi:Uma2 family endonuclease
MTLTLAKPHRVRSSDDLADLWELAERLQGRPLPNVRLTEWQFEEEFRDIKAEWVDGEVIIMAPVSGEHSDINIWLLRLFSQIVEDGDLGLVRGPEFPARFSSIRRWRSPDIMFIGKSKFSKLHPTHLDGAPDLVVEIISPDSGARDWRDKYSDYQTTGVREYWIIDPLSKRVDAYALGRSRRYSQIPPDDGGRIHSRVFKGLYINPQWLWRSPLPKLTAVLKELKLR